jgi:hypothetical protein
MAIRLDQERQLCWTNGRCFPAVPGASFQVTYEIGALRRRYSSAVELRESRVRVLGCWLADFSF